MIGELLAKTILLICAKHPTGQQNIKRQRNFTKNTFFLSFFLFFSFFFFFSRNMKLLKNFHNSLVESFFFFLNSCNLSPRLTTRLTLLYRPPCPYLVIESYYLFCFLVIFFKCVYFVGDVHLTSPRTYV